jgi:hypothetical protein
LLGLGPDPAGASGKLDHACQINMPQDPNDLRHTCRKQVTLLFSYWGSQPKSPELSCGPTPAVSLPLQRTQIIQHFAEFLDDLGIAEVAGGRISSPAEGHGSDMSRFAGQRFRAHDDRGRIEAFGRFAGRNAIVRTTRAQAASSGAGPSARAATFRQRRWTRSF